MRTWKTTYTPHPVDTSSVELPAGLIKLIYQLAENAHENWAAQRIKDGWRWGLSRDDKSKLHPDLVPYRELSRGEQEYDRLTAVETIKLIISLGFRIKGVEGDEV